jgi:lipoate-protein ligase A
MRGALGGLSIPDSYEVLHQGVLRALESLGIRAHLARPNDIDSPDDSSEPAAFLCFQRRSPTDLIVQGRKIVGSAQRRTRERLLQHGSVLLRAQPDGPRSVGVQDLLASPVTTEDVCQALVQGFEAALDAELVPGSLDADEILLAERLVRDRYEDPHWRRSSRIAPPR